jgi:pyrimidine-nucleoside phosphorylase
VLPYEILAKKRDGRALSRDEIARAVEGAARGTWDDAQLGAFLMAIAVHGADVEETRALTEEMLDSGERWDLAAQFPRLADKHSTGGVGDKTSIILTPLLAACDVPVVMLTGRALGHTGGTADKLESIPGLSQELSRRRAVELLERVGAAVGIATGEVAPADRRLYALRNRTGTVESIPLITASILSKKLATGAASIVFDVKRGDGAFLPEARDGEALARNLVEVTRAMGRRAEALLTDMSQPLGRWAGHACEIRECLEVLEGGGPADLRDVTLALAESLGAMLPGGPSRERLEGALADGSARERFDRWALAQGADPAWIAAPRFAIAPLQVTALATLAGRLRRVDTRGLGFLLAEEGALPGGRLDASVSLETLVRLGDRVEVGQEVARLFVREGRPAGEIAKRLATYFEIEAGESAAPGPELVRLLKESR